MSQQEPAPQPAWDKKYDKPITDALATLRQSVDEVEAATLTRIGGELRPRVQESERLVGTLQAQVTALTEKLQAEDTENSALAAEVKKTVDALEAELNRLKTKLG